MNNEMTCVMVDVETLDTRSTAVILSIAAVEFNRENIERKFHEFVSIDSCLAKGLTISESTLLWWLNQPARAREIFRRTTLSLPSVLHELSMWTNWNNIDEVWANGSDFDFPILANAYQACSLPGLPWGYNKSRDYRTVRKLFPRNVVEAMTIEPEVEHDALQDAIAQVYTLQALLASGNSFRSISA